MNRQFNFNDAYTDIMQTLVQKTQEITSSVGAALEVIDENELVYRCATGSLESYLGLRLDISNSFSGYCASQKTTQVTNDAVNDVHSIKSIMIQAHINSMVCTPVMIEDKIHAVLKVVSPDLNAYNEQSVVLVEQMAGLLGAAFLDAIHYTEKQTLKLEKDIILSHAEELTNINLKLNSEIEYRKEVEQKLLKRENFLHDILNTVPGSIHIYNIQTQELVYESGNFSDLIGYSHEELYATGNMLDIVIHPEDLNKVLEYQESFKNITDDVARELYHRLTHKDGRIIPILSRDVIFSRDDNGDPLELIGISIPIDSLKSFLT